MSENQEARFTEYNLKFDVPVTIPMTKKMARETRIKAAYLDMSRTQLVRNAVRFYLVYLNEQIEEDVKAQKA